jgi:hypothetical protein
VGSIPTQGRSVGKHPTRLDGYAVDPPSPLRGYAAWGREKEDYQVASTEPLNFSSMKAFTSGD